jgi:hypothetical protein
MEESGMVLDEARRHLATLGPLAKKLNAASDEFTEELRTIEAELRALNLGLEITLARPLVIGDLKDEVDDYTHETRSYRGNSYLAYGRAGKEWALLVRMFHDYEDANGDGTRSVFMHDTPLLSASRDLRMAAADQIDKLLKVIADEANAKLDSLTTVIDKKK